MSTPQPRHEAESEEAPADAVRIEDPDTETVPQRTSGAPFPYEPGEPSDAPMGGWHAGRNTTATVSEIVADCPDCGGEVLNLHGVAVCADCDWSTDG